MDKLGIDNMPTKYKIGDRFREPVNSHNISMCPNLFGGNWVLIDFVPVYTNAIGITMHRWKIKMHACGIIADVWSDDYWLDKLELYTEN